MEFFSLHMTTPPSHLSKNLSVLSHPRQNPLLVCIVPRRWFPCLLLSSRRQMKVKLVPLRLAGANFWPNSRLKLSIPLRVYLLLRCSVVYQVTGGLIDGCSHQAREKAATRNQKVKAKFWLWTSFILWWSFFENCHTINNSLLFPKITSRFLARGLSASESGVSDI